MIREKNANAVIITTPLDQLGGSQLLEIIEKKDTMLDDLLAEVGREWRGGRAVVSMTMVRRALIITIMTTTGNARAPWPW